VDPDDLASLIYTSGTTGDPKGVMLTHRNFTSNLLACAELFPLTPRDVALCLLPLGHAFERTAAHLYFYSGASIHYVDSAERIPAALRRVRPTVLVSVPRLYERAYQRARAEAARKPQLLRKLFAWALEIGSRRAAARANSFVGPLLWIQHAVARRLVLRPAQQRFGGRLRLAICGGAPLARSVEVFFQAAGLDLYQGYGLTETSPVLSVNHPGAFRLGSVGRPVAGVQLRFADDGEILVKSPGLTPGYWKNEQATAEALDPDGWFHTGDIGYADDDSFLFITDRKGELLLTSGGKNVSPQPIERLLTSSPLIAQAVVVGHGYPFLAALLVPDFEQLARLVGDDLPSSLAENPRTVETLAQAVREVNRKLAEHERLRRFKVLRRELSVEGQELTPTLEIRRQVVAERYGSQIEALYSRGQRI
jgi:long-chain acyl-CoA synthetase